MQVTFFRLGEMFETKRSKWSSVLQFGQVFSDASMKFIKEGAAKSNTHVVIVFDVLKVGLVLLSTWIIMKAYRGDTIEWN